MGSAIDRGKSGAALTFQRRSDQRLAIVETKLLEGVSLLAGGGLELAKLRRPAQRRARTRMPELAGTVAVYQLYPLPVAQQPAFKGRHDSVHAVRTQLAGQSGAGEGAQLAGIEIGDRAAVQTPGNERQRQKGRELEDKTTAGEVSHGPGRSYGPGRLVQAVIFPGVLLAISYRFLSHVSSLALPGVRPCPVGRGATRRLDRKST